MLRTAPLSWTRRCMSVSANSGTVGPTILSAEEAVQMIQPGNHLYVHSVAAYPRVLMKALVARARADESLKNLHLYNLHVEGDNLTNGPDLAPHKFFAHNYFVGKSSRNAVNEGRSTYIPIFLSEMPLLIRRRPPLDFALLNVSPPDRHGFCSLGTEVCTALAAATTARTIVAQINPNVPRTHGHTFIPFRSIDYVVDVEHEPDAVMPELHHQELGEVELKIGEILAAMIPDGATLQIGIGSIPDAVLFSLKNHKHLGIHSEMISDGVLDLLESGAVDNTKKDYIRHRTVSCFLLGTKRLYNFVHDNPGFHIDEASVTNAPNNIARNKKVVAINSALQVDLTGQVCADSIGTRMVSGVGGQLDFERGAALSDGGIPVICLASRSKKGLTSIVPTLTTGAGITTSRYHAHWIVTEYGAVDLWGKDLHERARLLISIAHPDDRETLAKAAFERYKTPFTF